MKGEDVVISNWTLTEPQIQGFLNVVLNDGQSWPESLEDCTASTTPVVSTTPIAGLAAAGRSWVGLDFSGNLEYHLPPPLCVVMDLLIKKQTVTLQGLWEACLPHYGKETLICIHALRHAVKVINTAIEVIRRSPDNMQIASGITPAIDGTTQCPSTDDLLVTDALYGGIIIVEFESID